MTVPNIQPVYNHNGDGETITFGFDFYIENITQLKVYKINASNIEILLEYGVDYTVSGVDNINGGTVTFPIEGSSHLVLKADESLSIRLDLPITQESEYGQSAKLNLPAFEYSYDYLTRICQILKRQLSQCIKVKDGGKISSDELVDEIFKAKDLTIANAESVKYTLLDVAETVSVAEGLLQNCQEFLAELQGAEAGSITFLVTHNLFEISKTDKKLYGFQLVGWGEQNTTQEYKYYPDAYNEIEKEFDEGTPSIFSSEDGLTLCKKYTGSLTGEFYIPLSANLDVGTTLYGDMDMEPSSIIGTVSSVSSIMANYYKGNDYDFYLSLDYDGITDGYEVFSDASLSNRIGLVKGVKNVLGDKYESSTTGTFYVDAKKEFKSGLKIYSNEALTEERGTITGRSTLKADPYQITNLGTCYVPENTVINVGTKLYSDKILSTQIATVTTKKSTSGTTIYGYKITKASCLTSPGGSGIRAWGITETSNVVFYTKTKITKTATLNIAMYQDKNCTVKIGTITGWKSSDGWFTTKNVKTNTSGTKIVASSASGLNATLLIYTVKSVSSTTTKTSNYICVNNGTTQLQYTKKTTVSTPVININTGNNETYSLIESYNKDFIKVGDLPYQSYERGDFISGSKIVINDGVEEDLAYNGSTSDSGNVFEYRLAEDGHKVVDIIYEDKIEEYILANNVSPFYIIDKKNKTFRLPLLEADSNIYFCVGNTKVKSASVDVLKLIYKELDEYNLALNEIIGG